MWFLSRVQAELLRTAQATAMRLHFRAASQNEGTDVAPLPILTAMGRDAEH